MNNPVIYKITSPSNKIYIGQSWNWIKRKSVYKRLSCKTQIKLYNSLYKYGYDNHIIEIIEILNPNISQNELNIKEIYWWNYYKELGTEMLNIRYPGSNGRMSKESIRKMSNSLKGRVISQESIIKGLETRKINNYKHSEETRHKIGNKHRGKEITLEVRQKISLKLKGIPLSEEHKLKIGLASRRPCSDSKKLKISLANKGSNNGMFGRVGKLNSTSKQVIDIETNEIFGSVAEVERKYNMKKNILSPKLRGIVKNNTNFRFL